MVKVKVDDLKRSQILRRKTKNLHHTKNRAKDEEILYSNEEAKDLNTDTCLRQKNKEESEAISESKCDQREIKGLERITLQVSEEDHSRMTNEIHDYINNTVNM